MPSYIPITREEMEEALGELGWGFSLVSLPNTTELVYGKRINPGSLADRAERIRSGTDFPLTLRVYSSIVSGVSREVGQDAIRIALVGKVGGKIVGVGRSKRINRVPGWERRLRERIEAWRDLLGPTCPRCGAPTKLRKSKRGEFHGCVRYPDCKGTVD